MRLQSLVGAVRHIPRLRHFSASALALGLLSQVGLAGAVPGVADIGLAFDQPLYEAGQLATVKVTGEPGDFAILLVASAPGDFMVPGLGQLGVAIDPLPKVVPLGMIPASGMISGSCQIVCESPILRIPCFVQAVTIDPKTLFPSGLSATDVLNVAAGDCGVCVEPAEILEGCGGGTFHVVTMPGIGSDYVFASGGSFVERGDGTALMSGVLERLSDPDRRWMLHMEFEGRVDPGSEFYPPVNSPKHQLCDEAYQESGGPINTDVWHYYTEMHGTLQGLGEFEGAELSVEDYGPAFQVGYGANGKNLEYGGSLWFSVDVLHQPSKGHKLPKSLDGGDVNMNLSDECETCAEAAGPDDDFSVQGGHALWLPEVATDFVFSDDGLFQQFPNGSARLTGKLYSESDPDLCFDAEILFSSRSNPGTESYPPDDSPKLELGDAAYSDDDGPIDTSLWHYYRETSGTLLGRKSLKGSQLLLTRAGPAFQVGMGASGKNLEYGASGWMTVEVLSQPSTGYSLPSSALQGDINVNLGCR